MSDLTFGIRLTADGIAYVNGVRVAQQATESLSDSARRASQSTDQLESSMRRSVVTGSALGTMVGQFVGRAIGDFGRWAVAGIEAAAAMNDLATATGSSVEALSGLQNSFRVSGVGPEALATALQRLSVAMAGTEEGSQRSAQALKLLGVTATNPADALKQLAVRLNGYADGANKAALVQDILGRGAQVLLPALKDLGNQTESLATVSGRTAAESETLQKGLRQLSLGADEVRDHLLSGLVPALNTLIGQFTDGITAAGGFWKALALGLTVDPFSSLRENLSKAEKELEDLQKGPAFLSIDDAGERMLAMFGIDIRKSRIDEALARIRYLKAQIGREFQPLPGTGADAYLGLGLPQAPTLPKAATSEVDAFAKAWARAQDTVQGAWQALSDFGETASNQVMPAMRALSQVQNSPAWDKFTSTQQKQLEQSYQQAGALQQEIARRKEAIAAVQQYAEAAAQVESILSSMQDAYDGLDERQQAIDDQWESFTKSLAQQNDQLKTQVATFGMSTEAAIKYTAAQQRASVETANLSHQQREEALAAIDTNEKLQLAAAAQHELSDRLQSIDSFAHDAFLRIGEDGTNAFKDIGSAIKRYVLDLLYQMTLRPIVLQIGASILGGGAASSAAASAGGSILNAAGGVSSLFGGSSGLSTLLGTGSGFLGLPSAGAAAANLSIVGAGGGLASIGGFGTALASIGTFALPVAALALLAGGSGLFGGKPSQVRGQFGIQGGTGGFEDNAFTSTPFGNIGFLDAGTQYFSGQGAQVFNQLIGGVLAGAAQRMTPTQIAAASGRLQGIDFQGMEGTFTTEEFIQKYGGDVLRQVVSTVFDELNPALGTLVKNFHGTADETVAYANSLLQLNDAVTGDPVKDAEEQWRQMNRSSTQALREQGQALSKLAKDYDGSAASTQALATATTAYRQALQATLVQIRQVQQAVGQMFAGTRETLETSGLSGRSLYDYYRSRADSTAQLLAASTDPAQIQQYAADINRYIGLAFGALDQTDQAAMKNPLLQYLNGVDSFVQGKLSALFDDTAAEGKGPLHDVQQAMQDAADGMNGAATTMSGAADKLDGAAGKIDQAAEKMLRAADGMQNMNVTVTIPEVNG